MKMNPPIVTAYMYNSKMSFVTVRKTVVDFSVFRVQLANIEGEPF